LSGFNWENYKSDIFTISGIVRRVNADKLFVSFLIEIEKRGIVGKKFFTLEEISDLIPRGTAGVDNYATYNFSIMSMLSGQGDRDYFIFEKKELRDEFTEVCNNTHNRDNNYWKKNHLYEKVKINPKYIKAM
jgi:hypothetical protein